LDKDIGYGFASGGLSEVIHEGGEDDKERVYHPT